MFWTNLSDGERRRAVKHVLPDLPEEWIADVMEFLEGEEEFCEDLRPFETSIDMLTLVVNNIDEIEDELLIVCERCPIAQELLKQEMRKLRTVIGLDDYDNDEMRDLMGDILDGMGGIEN